MNWCLFFDWWFRRLLVVFFFSEKGILNTLGRLGTLIYPFQHQKSLDNDRKIESVMLLDTFCNKTKIIHTINIYTVNPLSNVWLKIAATWKVDQMDLNTIHQI